MAEAEHANEPASPGGNRVEAPQKLPDDFFLNRLQGEPDSAPEPEETPALTAAEEREPDIAEKPSDETEEFEAGPDAALTDESAEADEPDEEREGIEVNGEFMTADQIVEALEGAENERMTLADYRRKTAYMNRIEDEQKALAEEFDASDQLLTEIAFSNVKRYENLNWAAIKAEHPEEHQRLLGEYQQVKQGAEFIQKQLEDRRTARQAKLDELHKIKAARAIELLRLEVPDRFGKRWNDEVYKEAGEYAVQVLQMPEAQFNQIRDPIYIQGLLALKVLDEANKVRGDGKKKRKAKRPDRTSNLQVQNAPRNNKGQFQSALSAALSSPNAKADGTFLEATRRRLEAERQENERR